MVGKTQDYRFGGSEFKYRKENHKYSLQFVSLLCCNVESEWLCMNTETDQIIAPKARARGAP